MASSSAIVWRNFAISSSRSARPNRVKRASCMSRMCSACTSLNSNGAAISLSRASPRLSDSRMAAMMASIMSRALISPSTMCALALRPAQAVLGPAADDVDLVGDVGLERRLQV